MNEQGEVMPAATPGVVGVGDLVDLAAELLRLEDEADRVREAMGMGKGRQAGKSISMTLGFRLGFYTGARTVLKAVMWGMDVRVLQEWVRRVQAWSEDKGAKRTPSPQLFPRPLARQRDRTDRSRNPSGF